MNLLITGAWQGAKDHLDALRAMGHEIVFLQQEKDALPVDPAWVEGVICNGLFLHHPIESFPNLQYIQLTSAGFDRVPMDYAKAHGIEIHNARGVYSIPMAEFSIAGVLQLYKQGRFFYENQKARRWEKRRDLMELSGKTVLILGCGDAFHLVPRVLNYFVGADFTAWLGIGKLVTSVTMTVFYVLLYFVWSE